MKKRLFFSLAPFAAIAPVALTVSCGKDEFFKETDMIGKDGKPIEGRKTVTTLAPIVSNPDFKLAESQKDYKTVFITDEGSIEDKSFNQSGWEAVHKLSYELRIDVAKSKGNRNLVNSYRQPGPGQLYSTYTSVVESQQYKYVVLCGFTHNAPLAQLFKDDKLRKIVEDKNMIFICIDFVPEIKKVDEEKDKDGKPLSEEAKKKAKEENAKYDLVELNGILKKHSIAVNFTTNIAGYMAGYALANYFAEKYPTDAAKRTIGAFGGIPWPGVSDFIMGTFQGIYDANKTLGGKTTRSIRDTINLDSGFESGTAKATSAIDEIKAAEAWYPVAGSLSVLAAGRLSKDQFLIGVDADQALALANVKIFTSVMKLVGQAIYNILGNFYTYGNVDKVPQLKNWATTGEALPFGYSIEAPTERYVNIAKASLENADNDKIADKYLDAARKYYEEHSAEILAEYAKLGTTYSKNPDKLPQVFQDICDGLAKAINAQK
ncbi:BMP family ABC transporter substrate-binding protein [Mycoplasmopsis adleri]|uniref:BMP family ABC transporter substrate-binding protein n=1 Tax=Mycoplasmopsis adleri TaxID=51362 RepID=UPI003872CFC1